MKQNIIFILTEGDHDSAFIYRILKANGISIYHDIPIKEYLSPLKELFESGFNYSAIENLGIESAKSSHLPNRVMKKDSSIISIFTMSGDAQKEKRINLIKRLNDFRVHDPDAIQAIDKGTELAVLYFLDADNKGIDSRMQQINEEIKEAFSRSDGMELKNEDIILLDDIKIGAFIFSEQGKNKGKLEDILIPLMKQDNDDIFDEACKFLDIHESCTLYKGKVEYDPIDNKTKKKVNNQKFDFKKSLIGTVGQLQKSGKSNTVCITDADYLTDDKIKSNCICMKLWGFISKVL